MSHSKVFSEELQKALKALKNNDKIVILRPEKGSGVVDKEDYIAKYKAMIWSQKSLLLKGNLHANIGEVTVFIFPELLVVTTSIRPEEQNNNNNDRSTSHFFYSGSPRQTRNSSTTSILNNSPFGSIAPLPLPQLPPPPPPLYQVSCAQPRFGHHRWSLLPSLKSHLPPDLDNVHSAPISSSSQPSKFTRLFRRLSSIIASSSSSSLSPPRPLSTVVQPEIIKNITATRLSNFFISEDDTVCLERYRICYPPLILKDYILEDMSDDDNRSSILKLPFSFEKSRRNLFRLYPYNEYCKRRSVKHVIKGINSLHSSHQLSSSSSASTSSSVFYLKGNAEWRLANVVLI
ncbi:unnamed protein product [Trichobilharzia regenti]|nr:unnamed protein product [Trichobilharzia regenti]